MDDRGRCETVKEMLKEWDAGRSVWTIEMGGLGPGYEQAIQILAIECLRELQRVRFKWNGVVKQDSDRCRAVLEPVVARVNKWPGCGFSGAQVGAAMQIAAKFHRDGPAKALDSAPEDRKTLVSKEWPHEPASATPEEP